MLKILSCFVIFGSLSLMFHFLVVSLKKKNWLKNIGFQIPDLDIFR